MPKAYVMIHLEITNREEFVSGFASKIPAMLAEFGGKPLVITGGPNAEGAEVSRLENQVTGRQADIHAIFEFPDRESAVAWYDSDQYKAILPARINNTANTYLAIVDGVAD